MSTCGLVSFLLGSWRLAVGRELEPRRGTGRTERMVQAAVACASSGGRALVVFVNDRVAQVWSQRIAHRVGGSVREGDYSFCIDFGGGITVIGSHNDGFDWDDLSHRGMRCEVFIDHFAVEDRYRRILDLAHRWDCSHEEGELIRAKWRAER